jgi:GNAT superfamily N-acetyltransferase
MPQDFRFLARIRRMGHPSSDYGAVYAVEKGQVLSRVETLHLAFMGIEGAQTVVGISDVLTRPEGIGRGYARTLLREVHRREKARGRNWSFLWTRRTWGAHRLYESLGYEDVYSPPSALREIPRSRRSAPPAGYRWRNVSRADAGRLERLLLRATAGRLGFVPRSRGSFRIRFELGWRKPENHRILLCRGREVGYAQLSEDSSWNLSTNEVTVTSAQHTTPMIEALEALARGRWLTFQGTSFVRDTESVLAGRGYAIYPSSHIVLMAKPLRSSASRGEDLRTVFRTARVSNHRGDSF